VRHLIQSIRIVAALVVGAAVLDLALTPQLAAQAPAGDVVLNRELAAREGTGPAPAAAGLTTAFADARLRSDLETLRQFRPAYTFWQHIFTIPDGRVVFGSAKDGRLLATFPTAGDWTLGVVWSDDRLASLLAGRQLPTRLNDRRDEVARLLEPSTGPLLHNMTRGQFLIPNIPRYGSFIDEWGSIYERFGVPAEIGLAQAIVESGLKGTARSRANAVGLCQWLMRNWRHVDRLSPAVLEAYNQTTQAPYCAAYLSILATMYGSFIPALSEHHAGGVNVGRAVINGERLGGADTRQQYLLGARFAHDLRNISLRGYRDLYRTYGVRSFLYAEMVFGNTVNVSRIRREVPQTRVFAMRSTEQIPVAEITRRTGLSTDELKRYNPAILQRVPAQANLYLPTHVAEFGVDVSFWHRPPSAAYSAALNDFLQLDAGVQRWHEASFDPVLRGFQRRFEETNTEEGDVMSTMLAYVIDDLRTSRRGQILEDFRTSGRILELFKKGVAELGTLLPASE
jgi:Transglycosylase SLT domain